MNPSINHICHTDDDPDDHLIFSTVLKEIFPEATLFPFYNCGELLQFLKEENTELPEIIFIDQNMPGNRGNECLQEIKQMARTCNIPVVLYSTSGEPKTIDKAIGLGAYKYIIKPSTFGETKVVISEILSTLSLGYK